jgi:hypothetical protein
MNRLLALLAVGLLASAATADVPPPPPPKGTKYVTVDVEVVLGKDVSGYVYVQRVVSGPGRPRVTFTKLDLTADKAAALAAGGRRTDRTLFAVPRAAVAEFKTDADLFDALAANKVKGAHDIGFAGTATVSDTVKGDTVKWTYTITAIDAKDGIKTKVEGEGSKPPEVESGKKAQPPTPVRLWVAGVAAFAAVTLGGFWVAGRTRRRV